MLTGLSGLVLTGCVSDLWLLHSDDTALARTLAERQAMTDMKCLHVQSERPIVRDSLDYWTPGIASEYQVRVEGCGKVTSYGVVCREEGACDIAQARSGNTGVYRYPLGNASG